MVSRRRFLAAGSKAALAAGVIPSLLIGRRFWGRSVIPTDELTPSVFHGLERTPFAIRSGLQKTTLRLVSVGPERVSAIPGTGKIADFSLLFSGSDASPLEQETYRFEHDDLGAFDLFIVPVDRSENGKQQYQAVFNRILV